ncbi:hypothetical protein [Streptomyces sp. NPDC003077]|uniref:hypothetical protein n=1 Tax=Streptomyces sp. NPDC003077 TaxID=3154443 RepID=UPI0033A4DE66
MTHDVDERRKEARRIAAQMADDLQTSLSARGFHLPMRAGTPIGGRPHIAVDPIPHDTARRLCDVLKPAPALPSVPEQSDPFAHVEHALATLRQALFGAGLVLPSLGLDLPSAVCGTPLVRLGNARPDVVRQVAVLLRQGTTQ